MLGSEQNGNCVDFSYTSVFNVFVMKIKNTLKSLHFIMDIQILLSFIFVWFGKILK